MDDTSLSALTRFAPQTSTTSALLAGGGPAAGVGYLPAAGHTARVGGDWADIISVDSAIYDELDAAGDGLAAELLQRGASRTVAGRPGRHDHDTAVRGGRPPCRCRPHPARHGRSVVVPDGCTLLLFTDGVIEHRNPSADGLAHLAALTAELDRVGWSDPAATAGRLLAARVPHLDTGDGSTLLVAHLDSHMQPRHHLATRFEAA